MIEIIKNAIVNFAHLFNNKRKIIKMHKIQKIFQIECMKEHCIKKRDSKF